MSVRINENMPSCLRSTAIPMPVGIAAEAIKGLLTLAAVAAAELVIVLFEPRCTEDCTPTGHCPVSDEDAGNADTSINDTLSDIVPYSNITSWRNSDVPQSKDLGLNEDLEMPASEIGPDLTLPPQAISAILMFASSCPLVRMSGKSLMEKIINMA